MSDTKWFVVHTYSGYENKVAANIEKMVENRGMQDQILEIKIPTRIETEIKDGQKIEIEEKCYPCYVFVKAKVAYNDEEELSMTEDAWFVIRNTRGVTGFVGPESKATPLSDKEVEAFGIESEALESKVASANLSIGESVEITEESLAGMVGTVSSIDLANERVVLTVDWFGKKTTVDLSIYDVKEIAND